MFDVSYTEEGMVCLALDGHVVTITAEAARALAVKLSENEIAARHAQVKYLRMVAANKPTRDGLGAKGPGPRDYSGQRFGYLVAVRITRKMPVFWLCRCDCGKEVEVRSHRLADGRRRSCGCKARAGKRVVSEERNLARSSWRAMKERCRNPKDSAYSRYGAKGVDFCDEWLSFDKFIDDMGERPIGTSLDRIDVTRGYCKANCRWATPEQQSRNRSNVKLTVEQVAEIRLSLSNGDKPKWLALRYGVAPNVIQAINQGRTWRNVPAAA